MQSAKVTVESSGLSIDAMIPELIPLEFPIHLGKEQRIQVPQGAIPLLVHMKDGRYFVKMIADPAKQTAPMLVKLVVMPAGVPEVEAMPGWIQICAGNTDGVLTEKWNLFYRWEDTK